VSTSLPPARPARPGGPLTTATESRGYLRVRSSLLCDPVRYAFFYTSPFSCTVRLFVRCSLVVSSANGSAVRLREDTTLDVFRFLTTCCSFMGLFLCVLTILSSQRVLPSRRYGSGRHSGCYFILAFLGPTSRRHARTPRLGSRWARSPSCHSGSAGALFGISSRVGTDALVCMNRYGIPLCNCGINDVG